MRCRYCLFVIACLLSIPQANLAASKSHTVQRCEPDEFIYQWRDAMGGTQLGDCAPEGVAAFKRIPRNSLQPTIIQPPPKPAKPVRKTRRKYRNTRNERLLSSETLRGLNAKCRWLVGRIEHLKGLVTQHRRGSERPSIWQPELTKRRAELRKAKCGVRL